MAKQIEKQMQDQLNQMYANEGRLKREIQDYNNQLTEDLSSHQREELEKLLTAAQVNLSRTEDGIDRINGDVDELKEKPWNMGFINDNPYINGNISNINVKNIDDVNDNSNSQYILCDVVLKIKRNYDFKELSRNNYLTSEILVLYIDKTW